LTWRERVGIESLKRHFVSLRVTTFDGISCLQKDRPPSTRADSSWLVLRDCAESCRVAASRCPMTPSDEKAFPIKVYPKSLTSSHVV
jgi:hypothetical protein